VNACNGQAPTRRNGQVTSSKLIVAAVNATPVYTGIGAAFKTAAAKAQGAQVKA